MYVPAWRQPFKTDRTTASAFHRFAMAVLAVEPYDDLDVSPRELERGAISYTVDTLEEVRSEEPDATVDWIIGDDNLAELTSWKSVDRILELANFAVLARDASATVPPSLQNRVADASSRSAYGPIVFARNETVTVSATEIRRRVAAGESIDGLVDPRVSRYIHRNRLYRESSPEQTT
jgi:nicotinate-nucleotide adenylyltransferase